MSCAKFCVLQVSLCLLLLVTLSNCEPPATSYGVPINSYVNNQLTAPNNNYNTGNNNYNNGNNNNYNAHHGHEGQDPDHSEPKSYEFGYAVKDDYSGNDYKRRETSDGNQVTGEYRVQLPDGRTQIVTYYADWQSGFHADVRYEGTAQYPDQQPQYPGNAYQNPGNQYGAPNLNNQYGAPFNNNNQGFNSNPASSSVTIKDFSGPSTPYNTNNGGNGGYNYGGNNNFNGADNFANNYDSYANNGNFGSRSRPSNAYGAP